MKQVHLFLLALLIVCHSWNLSLFTSRKGSGIVLDAQDIANVIKNVFTDYSGKYIGHIFNKDITIPGDFFIKFAPDIQLEPHVLMLVYENRIGYLDTWIYNAGGMTLQDVESALRNAIQ